ncbi:MAG: DNA repair protein [Pseudomonadales bacterium]|nr:DNA repair protein [Pseudomonadales bacterium]
MRILLLALLAGTLCACESMYYNAMEKVGVHKRDIMVDRVEEAQDAQQDAKEQFASALEQYQALLGVQDQELQETYDSLNDEYEDSKAAAQAVSDRIDAVASVSEALFEEWEEELSLYSNQSLKQQSARQLNATRKQYSALIQSMRQAESRMQPVLAALQDQVLYLKHNLNARAIDGLKGELRSIESNVARLIKDMEASIAQSQEFIATLNKNQ